MLILLIENPIIIKNRIILHLLVWSSLSEVVYIADIHIVNNILQLINNIKSSYSDKKDWKRLRIK